MADDVIKTTGLELTVMDDHKSVTLTFASRDNDPVKVSMPLVIANKLADFIKEKIAEAAQAEAEAEGSEDLDLH